MRLTGINLENFISHKKTSINFPTNQDLVLIKGLNGSGKSSLMDAVCYGLYGKLDRGAFTRPKQLVHDGQETACVIIELEGMKVVRRIGRKSANVNMIIDGENESARTSTLTQIKIERMLGFSFNSFMSASYISQGKVGAFVDGNSSSRVKILSDVLNLGAIDESVKASRNKVHMIQDGVTKSQLKVDMMKEELDRLGDPDSIAKYMVETKDHIRAYERELNSLKRLKLRIDERDQLKSRYVEEIRALDSNLAGNRLELERLLREAKADQKRLNEAETEFKKMEQAKSRIDELKSILDKTPYPNKLVSEHTKSAAKNAADVQHVLSEIEKLEKVLKDGGICPTCKRKVEGGHKEIQKAIDGLESDKMSLAKERTELDHQLGKAQKEIELNQEAETAYQNAKFRASQYDIAKRSAKAMEERMMRTSKRELELKSKQSKMKKDVARKQRSFRRKIKTYDDIDESYDDIDVGEQMEKLQKTIGSHRERVKNLVVCLKQSKYLTQAIKQKKVEQSKSSKRLFYYEYWSERFPQIKLGLIDAFVPQMEEIANQILSSFSPIRIRLSTVMEKQSGGVMDKFRIVVYHGSKQREWENWSGGEKKQVAVAICLAMNTTLWNMGFGLNFIMMDEVFADLDTEKRPLILDYLVKSGRSVFVISHTDINPSFFDRVITIKNINGVSQING